MGKRKAPSVKLEYEEEDVSEKVGEVTASSVDEKAPPRWEPPNWRETWAKIAEMRKMMEAPVDSDGCERLHDPTADPKVRRYQSLVALMLSAQTKDTVNAQTMRGLMDEGLTPERIRDMPLEEFEKRIQKVSFYRKKAVYIKDATEFLLREYDGDVPPTTAEMMRIRGLGPKMAHLLAQCAWGVAEGIGVDIHVHRITDRLLWSRKSRSAPVCKSPEDTRKALESWLPRDLWTDINPLLVGFGQTLCKAVKPNCEECLLSAGDCPSSRLTPAQKKQRRLELEERHAKVQKLLKNE